MHDFRPRTLNSSLISVQSNHKTKNDEEKYIFLQLLVILLFSSSVFDLEELEVKRLKSGNKFREKNYNPRKIANIKVFLGKWLDQGIKVNVGGCRKRKETCDRFLESDIHNFVEYFRNCRCANHSPQNLEEKRH